MSGVTILDVMMDVTASSGAADGFGTKPRTPRVGDSRIGADCTPLRRRGEATTDGKTIACLPGATTVFSLRCLEPSGKDDGGRGRARVCLCADQDGVFG